MGVTNFPHGVASMGIPLYGGPYIPPIPGTYYHVLPGSTGVSNGQGKQYVGSSSNTGLDLTSPLDSIATAYNKCVDGAGDGIILWSYGTSTAMTTSYLTSALTWAKSGITVVGVCAPTRMAQRARIANASTAASLANLITVSGDNNTFLNMSFYNGGTTGAGGVMVAGKRNYFGNVHFMGGMGMTTPTVTDYDLYISGGQENTFEGCTIGSDTFDKTDIAGAELFLGAGAERNNFYGCHFVSYRSAGTTAGIIKLVGSGDAVTRTHWFKDCRFEMYRDGATTSEVGVVIGTMPNNGFLVFMNSIRIGFVDWATTATNRIFSASATMHESGGLALAANPS